ncbi:LuxR C-terminal-related transcriptional regulator [uncultured Chryseobacterium sp.]|uniref:helix-turn-helix domain-containing protein n=1 Tax=uncultured Chryseobacterium sp. TaxID=259322 RepID=UPI002588290A|nr:LuxR C-terminal-related transcriptional regulator [uncultured Chryseobacterium sp.]
MFGTEIHIITFIYICLLILILGFALIRVSANEGNKSFDLHFLLLTFAVILNNVSSGLLPDKNFSINILSQNVIAYTIGFITIGYYIYFLSKYYSLTFKNYLHFNYVIICLSVNLVVGFIIPYVITGNLEISRKFFLIIPVCFILFLIYIIYKNKTEDYLEFYDQFRKFHAVAGLLGLFSVVSVPATMLLLGDNQSIEQSLFTIGYFFIGIEYFFYKGKGRNWGLLSDLTERETEIVNLIIENKNIKYVEIGSKLNISEKTVSAHLSNIYKKVDVKGKKGLITKIENNKIRLGKK